MHPIKKNEPCFLAGSNIFENKKLQESSRAFFSCDRVVAQLKSNYNRKTMVCGISSLGALALAISFSKSVEILSGRIGWIGLGVCLATSLFITMKQRNAFIDKTPSPEKKTETFQPKTALHIWNSLNQQIKIDFINQIINNPTTGNKQVRMSPSDKETINICYNYTNSGTGSKVYRITFGNTNFALKLMHPGLNPGLSAKKLQNHCIKGLVQTWSSEVLETCYGNRAIIIMDYLENNWSDGIYKTKQNSLISDLQYIKNILETLIELKKQGFTHGNIGESNIMFNEECVYIIDIDDLPSTTYEYASFLTQNDMRNIISLIHQIIIKHCLPFGCPLNDLCNKVEREIRTPEEFLAELMRYSDSKNQ